MLLVVVALAAAEEEVVSFSGRSSASPAQPPAASSAPARASAPSRVVVRAMAVGPFVVVGGRPGPVLEASAVVTTGILSIAPDAAPGRGRAAPARRAVGRWGASLFLGPGGVGQRPGELLDEAVDVLLGVGLSLIHI